MNIHGTLSQEFPLESGVPQGSVMGAILFLIYTLPIGDIFTKNCIPYHIYADDNQNYLAFRIEKIEDKISEIIDCLQDLREWLLPNMLKSNGEKLELSVHGTPQQLAKLENISIKVDGVVLTPKAEVRNLGVIFDPTLSMKPHVNALCKRAYHELHNINCIRSSLNKEAAAMVIHSFVTSRIDNCNALLYGLPNSTIYKVQGVQNSAARTLTGAKRRDHITPVLKSLHWLKVKPRIEYKLLIIVYKCLYGNGPQYLKDLLVFKTHSRNLRSSADNSILEVPKTKLTTGGDRSFHRAGPTLWNNLPQHIRQSDTLSQFKSKLKKHLYQREYLNEQ